MCDVYQKEQQVDDDLMYSDHATGISTEDAARGGAKRKECVGRREQSVNCEQSAVQADNLNGQTFTEENKQNMSAAVEEMDVDMDVGIPEPVCSEISKDIDESTAVNGETLKNETPVGLGKVLLINLC